MGERGNIEGALHFCVRNNSEELLNIILSHPRVNVNIMANNGRTPLMIACLTQKVKIIMQSSTLWTCLSNRAITMDDVKGVV